jgi:hypothetical protein
MLKKILLFGFFINASLSAVAQSVTFKELLSINNSKNENPILGSKHFKIVFRKSFGNIDTVKCWYKNKTSLDPEIIITGIRSTPANYKPSRDINYSTYNNTYILTLKNQVIADGFLFKNKKSKKTCDDYIYLKGDLHVHVIIQKQKNVRSSVVIRHFY